MFQQLQLFACLRTFLAAPIICLVTDYADYDEAADALDGRLRPA